MHLGNCERTQGSRQLRFLRLRSVSALPRRSFPWCTACCCGHCRTPIQTGLWLSTKSSPMVDTTGLPIRTLTIFATKVTASRRLQSMALMSPQLRAAPSRRARRSRTSLHSSSKCSAFSRSSAAIWPLPTIIKVRLRSPSSATDIGSSISDHL